ncbi:hypothetical protein DENSPDRAFT_810519 [Dentipellis sp. KUC8613]|nr:hypothetical protein DENSPDRAFT_810519 [Dentipellis sp. KUC8613]
MTYALFRHSVLSVLRTPAAPSASSSIVCPRLATRAPSARWYAAAPPGATNTRPRNKNIPYKTVRVVDAETGKLGPPQYLEDVLASLGTNDSKQAAKAEKKKYFVELAAPPSPATDGYALVKLRDIKAVFDQEREMRQRRRQTLKHNETKEVQLTWGVAESDLDHKLRKVRVEIGKGYRVDVVIALKKTQAAMSPAEREATVESVLAKLQDVAREWKQRDVTRSMTVLHLQDRERQLPPGTRASSLPGASSASIPPSTQSQ